MSKGTIAQKERWALDLLTLDKIGAWAITRTQLGVRRVRFDEGDGPPRWRRVRTQRLEDVHHHGPFAETIVFICKLDEGNPPEDRKVLSFVLDTGMPGLVQSKALAKMGMHSSPTGDCSSMTCASVLTD